MIASLPMYERPELMGANDRFWDLIHYELKVLGIDSPERLAHGVDSQQTWTDPGLVLSQTCGMPYRNRLHGRVTLIGTPDFAVADCPPGYYRSAIVVRSNDQRSSPADYRSAVFAYNEIQSQSGYNAAFHYITPFGFWFENRVATGAHLESARSVADGIAEIASIDAVTWRYIKRYENFSDKLRVLASTQPTPGLPYISALGVDRGRIFTAVATAISRLEQDDRQSLGICQLVYIPADDYLSVPNPS